MPIKTIKSFAMDGYTIREVSSRVDLQNVTGGYRPTQSQITQPPTRVTNQQTSVKPPISTSGKKP